MVSKLIQIIDSQLLVFPTYRSLLYRGTSKDESDYKLLTIKLMECDKDLIDFDYIGKKTGIDEITLIIKQSHYQDLINLHLNRQKPDKMFLKFKKNYVSYYGFSC